MEAFSLAVRRRIIELFQGGLEGDDVAEIMAWKDGKRIGIGSPHFLNSTRWIRLAAPGYVLYSEPDDAHQILDVPPPGEGIGMSATDVDELSSLVNPKTAVTVVQ